MIFLNASEYNNLIIAYEFSIKLYKLFHSIDFYVMNLKIYLILVHLLKHRILQLLNYKVELMVKSNISVSWIIFHAHVDSLYVITSLIRF